MPVRAHKMISEKEEYMKTIKQQLFALTFIIALAALAMCAGAADSKFVFLGVPENNGSSGYFTGYLKGLDEVINDNLPAALTKKYHIIFASPTQVRKEALQMGYDPENYSGMSTDELTDLARNLDCQYVMNPIIDTNKVSENRDGLKDVLDVLNGKSLSHSSTETTTVQITTRILDVKTKRVLRVKYVYKKSDNRKDTYDGGEILKQMMDELVDSMDGVVKFEVNGSVGKGGNITIDKCYNWEALRPGDKGFVFYKDKGTRKKLANVTVVSSDEKKTVLTAESIMDEGTAKKKQTLYYTFSVTDPMYEELVEDEE